MIESSESGKKGTSDKPTFIRKLAAIAFADVAGYSKLMALNDQETITRWQDLRRNILEPLIEEAGGRLVEMAGDALLVEFPSAVQALRWSCDVQQTAETSAVENDPFELKLRIGVNVDDVIEDEGTLQGDGVNIAARIHQLAEPGQIVISGAVREFVGNRLPVRFTDLGTPKLKNIDKAIRLYSVNVGTEGEADELHHPYLEWHSRPGIAVMPFRSASAESEVLAAGIIADIITGLSRRRSLHVISSASMWRYADRRSDLGKIARELGVSYILDGTMLRNGDQLRINTELVHAEHGRVIWAQHFEGKSDEVFDFQDRITSTILASIEPRLHEVESGRVRSRPTSSLGAYECVLKASSLLYDFTPESFRQSGHALSRAIELDPYYAQAYTHAAWRLNFVVAEQHSDDAERDSILAIRYAQKALHLDPEDAFTLSVAGHLISFLERRPHDAMELFDTALHLDPNSAFSWALSGDTLSYLGRPDEAIKRFRNVWKLNPYDRHNFFWWSGAGIAEFVAGRYTEAVAWLNKAQRANPRFVATLRMLAAAQALDGQQKAAERTAEQLLAIMPSFRVKKFVEVYPLERPDDLARLEQGLLMAGIPK